jgi:hypothetical protein
MKECAPYEKRQSYTPVTRTLNQPTSIGCPLITQEALQETRIIDQN